LVAVDQADVLRDEGRAYVAKLRAAGVSVTTVRYDGTIHDFMMLNPLSHERDEDTGRLCDRAARETRSGRPDGRQATVALGWIGASAAQRCGRP
jgi:acetyl esterase/lipase